MAFPSTLTAFVARATPITASWLNAVDKLLVGHPFGQNVIGHGAVGDGTTDDTAAIHAARTAAGAGGRVRFPSGKTFLVGNLTATQNNQVWDACGATIKQKGSTSGALVTTGVGVTGFTLRGGTLDGNKSNQSAVNNGIVCTQGSGHVIDGVTFQNIGGRPIYLFQSTDSAVTNNRVLSTGKSESTNSTQCGIYLHAVQRVRVANNLVDGGTDIGILLGSTGCTDVTITGNVVRDVNFIGIGLGSLSEGCTVSGNSVSGVSGNGIDPGSCISAAITGNVVRDCEAGIICDGNTAVSITGNIIENMVREGGDYVSTGRGIAVGGAGGTGITPHSAVITGNVVRGTAGHGITTTGGSGVIMSNNLVENAGQVYAASGGILVYSTTDFPASNISITGNICRDDQGTKTQDYGILLFSSTNGDISDVLIANNKLAGNSTAGYATTLTGSPAGTVTDITLRDNIGYVTRNAGATSVADGGTISHGLATTPTWVTATCSTADEYASVSAKSSTTFTVQLTKHDGTAGTTATVYWTAEV